MNAPVKSDTLVRKLRCAVYTRKSSEEGLDRDFNTDHALTESHLVIRWGCSRRTLQRWRTEGRGPTFVRLGGSIRYLLSDVIAFEDQSRCAAGKAP